MLAYLAPCSVPILLSLRRCEKGGERQLQCSVLHDRDPEYEMPISDNVVVAEQGPPGKPSADISLRVRHMPKKRPGRPSILTQAQVEELVEFVCASAKNRRMSYEQLAKELEFGVKKDAIRNALMEEGYYRRLAMRKPPISEKNRATRLAWSLEHRDWTMEQWYEILWTDETWVTSGRHTRTWVTRRAGEEWEPTCIIEKHQRKKGWMFWGCFHGHTQGPGSFGRRIGGISAETYRQHTVPVIHGYIELQRREGIHLKLMQDGAPGHAAADTKQDLQERGIEVISWPPFSPDLNPIEWVWHIMKNYLQDNFPEVMSYDVLRAL
jgi:hypothetical protein